MNHPVMWGLFILGSTKNTNICINCARLIQSSLGDLRNLHEIHEFPGKRIIWSGFGSHRGCWDLWGSWGWSILWPLAEELPDGPKWAFGPPVSPDDHTTYSWSWGSCPAEIDVTLHYHWSPLWGESLSLSSWTSLHDQLAKSPLFRCFSDNRFRASTYAE